MDYKFDNINALPQQQQPPSYYPQVPQSFPAGQQVYTTQPNMSSFPILSAEKDWSFGLLDCFEDIGGFLCACCCTPCYSLQVFSKAGEGFCDCFCAGLVPLRTKVRIQRGIKGSLCEDACISAFCTPCALVQISNEIERTPSLI